MKNSKDSTRTPTDLLHEFKALIAEAEHMMTGDGSPAAEPAADITDTLRARFDAARTGLSNAYDGARKRVSAGAKAADTTIRENPYQALAIAAGLGLLAGVLVGRRTK